MRATTWFTGFSLYASAIALQARDDASPSGTNDTATIAPNHFIIEFSPDIDASATAQDVADNHGGRVLKVFQSEVFHGCAIEAPETNADLLQALDIVNKAWPSRKFFLGPSEPQLLFDGDVVYENYSIHHMTGVDKLHKQGTLGKGAKVAVIDTGVNYNHPALGGGFGDGFKVSRGHDFVGDEIWPTPGYDKKPDSDPDDKQGHGSHVAGIVAGKGDAMTGVAPEAEIFAYKVFSTIDGTDEETIIEAMIAAFDDGADIITISIGGVSGWTDGPWALIANKLVDLGVLITVSAGNDGNVGALAASSGSSGFNVLAIASVEPDVITVPGFQVTYNRDDGSSEDAWEPYRSPLPWYPAEVIDWPVVPLSLEPLDDDACAPLPDDTPDFTGKIPLVRRGGCTFLEKQQNLAAFNASHILFYTNEEPFTGPSSIDSSILLAMITAKAGKSIVDTIAAGGNVTVNFDFPETHDRVAIKNFDLPGVASPFTSIGPTNDLYIKSDVGAPGGEILSTVLGDGYASFSGTSMACPYVAGIAALYVSKFGGRSEHGPEWAKKLVMRIIASGEALPWDDAQLLGNTYDFFAPVAQVGTGLVNASKVLTHDTDLSLARFALNDTHHFSRYHKVDITNNGDSPIEYTFSQEAFGGLSVMNNNADDWATPRPAWIEELMTRPVQLVPSISFPRSGFTVQPGQTRTAQFNFDYPKNGTAKDLPIYSGKVLIHGSNGDELSIPYLGLAANLKKDNELMYQNYPIGLPIITSTTDDIPISEKANFTFDLSLEAQDFPRAHARLQLATRELRWDIFETSWQERHWKYPPVVGKDGYIGAVTGWADAGWNIVFDPEINDADNLVTTPLLNVARSVTGRRGVDLWWLGKLANGTTLAPGEYKMRLAVLKPFGNPKAADNWDVVDTPIITIL